MATFIKIILLVVLLFANIIIWKKALNNDTFSSKYSENSIEHSVQTVSNFVPTDSLDTTTNIQEAEL